MWAVGVLERFGMLSNSVSSSSQYSYRSVLGNYFTFHVDKLLDCHYTLLFNSSASDRQALSQFDSLYRKLTMTDLDFNLLWEELRYPLVRVSGPEDLFQKIQQTLEEIARAISDNLLHAMPVYESRVFPAHKPRLDSALDFLEKTFLPREQLLYRELARSLSYAFKPPMPVYLTGSGTTRGAFTSEPSLTVINVSDLNDMDVAELVLHEVVHGAENLNQSRSQSALAILNAELKARDKSASFPSAWHALIFWNAGELTRRLLDPNHTQYGDRYGVYKRDFARERELYSRYWNAWLDGKMSLREALADVAEGL